MLDIKGAGHAVKDMKYYCMNLSVQESVYHRVLPCVDISTTVTLIQSGCPSVPVRVAVNSTTPASSVTVRLGSLRQYMIAGGEKGWSKDGEVYIRYKHIKMEKLEENENEVSLAFMQNFASWL